MSYIYEKFPQKTFPPVNLKPLHTPGANLIKRSTAGIYFSFCGCHCTTLLASNGWLTRIFQGDFSEPTTLMWFGAIRRPRWIKIKGWRMNIYCNLWALRPPTLWLTKLFKFLRCHSWIWTCVPGLLNQSYSSLVIYPPPHTVAIFILLAQGIVGNYRIYGLSPLPTRKWYCLAYKDIITQQEMPLCHLGQLD